MNNFFDVISMIQNGSNPQQLLINMLQAQAKNDPRLEALIPLVKSNNTKGVENFARNLLSSQGKDFDKEFEAFRRNYRL